MLSLLVLTAAVLYLAVIGAYQDLFLSVKELEESRLVWEGGGGETASEIFRISVDLRTGEISFLRERTEPETEALIN